MIFSPKLNILPESQWALRKELKATANHFALYGGSALDLNLGHRASEDLELPVLAARRDLVSQGKERWSTPKNF
jgi:hypothetical protein